MADILHRVGIKSSVDESLQGIDHTRRSGGLVDEQYARGGQGRRRAQVPLQRRCSEIGGFDMKVLEVQPAKLVLWQLSTGLRNGSAPGSGSI